ncbi:MAG: ribonuclease HI [bacterium]|nr:ribonuclease HI [bacterium]
MANKFYVVWVGKKTGIFTDWSTCQAQVQGHAGAKFKSYKTRFEAEAAFRGGAQESLKKAKTKKTTSRKYSGNSPKTYSAAEIEDLPFHTKIFTDGGCEPNPGKAASGMAVYREGKVEELWFGLFNPAGTNNTAELNALHQALQTAEKELANQSTVAIFCDSKYSIQCITQWAFNWEKKGWKKPGGEIKNLELIQNIFGLYKRLQSKVQVLHVNGHVGVEGNELADRMSIHGIESQEAGFVCYPCPLDLKKILALRAG